MATMALACNHARIIYSFRPWLFIPVLCATSFAQERRAKPPEMPVQEVIDRWVRAQNDGDFAGYEALYARSFTGVRRSGSRQVTLDRAHWMNERRRMFARPMHIAIESVAVQPGARPDLISLTFTQTWESGAYRDVGEKKMDLIRGAARAQIVREEMLTSRVLPSDSRTQLDECGHLGSGTHEQQCYRGTALKCLEACAEAANVLSKPQDGKAPTREDLSKAIRLLERACVNDYGPACLDLAEALEEKQPARAVKLFVKACELESRSAWGQTACQKASAMYRGGAGIPANRALKEKYQELSEQSSSGE